MWASLITIKLGYVLSFLKFEDVLDLLPNLLQSCHPKFRDK